MHKDHYSESALALGLEPLSYSDFTALRKAKRSNYKVHRTVIFFDNFIHKINFVNYLCLDFKKKLESSRMRNMY